MRWNALIVSIAMVFVGCDPGVHYAPRGWTKAGDYRWSFQNADFRVVMSGPGELIGSKSITPEADVTNTTREVIIFESARIVTGDRRYEGRFGTGARFDPRTVQPDETKRIHMFFDFNDLVTSAVGDSFQLVVEYRVGGSIVREMTVVFEKS